MVNFTANDLHELYRYIDHTRGMSIDGESINCFEKLYSIVSQKKPSSISENEINCYIKQISLLKESHLAFGCNDCSLLDKLILYLENMNFES